MLHGTNSKISFVVTDTCEQTAKGTSSYYKVVFITLSTIIRKFSLNP